MQIVHTPVAGLFRTSRAEAQAEYDKANRAQLSAQAIVAQYRKYLTQPLLAEFAAIEDWYSKNYENFKKASELSYGNWSQAANIAQGQYESFDKKAQAVLIENAAQIEQDGGGEIKFPDPTGEKPFIPGLPAEANTWLIAGAVGLALIIGIALAKRQK